MEGVKDIFIKSNTGIQSCQMINNKFFAKIPLSDPSIINISFGKNLNVDLFVCPGDHVSAFINLIELKNSGKLTFVKGNVTENQYLNKLDELLKYDLPNNYYFFNCKQTEFVSKLNDLEKEANEILENYNNKSTSSSQFIYQAGIYIRSSLLTYAEKYSTIVNQNFPNHVSNNTLKLEEYCKINRFKENELFNNSKFLKYIEEKSFIKARDSYSKFYPEKSMLNDLYLAIVFTTVDSLYTSKDIKDYINFFSLKGMVLFGVEIRDTVHQLYLKTLPTATYIEAYDKLVFEFGKLQKKGLNIFEYKFYDINNNERSFREFKGSYVYIDVWASWCGPCLLMKPKFEEVRKYFQNDQRFKINFVEVSLDSESGIPKWTKIIKKDHHQTNHFIADGAFKSPFSKDFFISAIPRFILIAPDGSVLDKNFASPYDDNIINLLKKHLVN